MAYQGKHYGNVRPGAQESDNSGKKYVDKKEKKKEKYKRADKNKNVSQSAKQRNYNQGYNQSYNQSIQQSLNQNDQVTRKKAKKPKLRIRWGRFGTVLLLFLVLLSTSIVVGYGFYLQRKMVAPNSQVPALVSDQPVNLLLVGLDRDTASYDRLRQQSMNADTIVLAHLQPNKHTASLLLIPGNTRVDLPTGPDQISHAYALGGIDLLEQSVHNLTGLSADRYMTVDFSGFAQAIDAIGGIDFNVPQNVSDPEQIISVDSGEQHLNGRQALTVLRYKNGDTNDLVRVQREQQFITALQSQLQTASTLVWFKGLRAMSDSVQTNLTLLEMSSLLPAVHTSDAQLSMNIVPGDSFDLYGQTYWMTDDSKLAGVVQHMQQ